MIIHSYTSPFLLVGSKDKKDLLGRLYSKLLRDYQSFKLGGGGV